MLVLKTNVLVYVFSDNDISIAGESSVHGLGCISVPHPFSPSLTWQFVRESVLARVVLSHSFLIAGLVLGAHLLQNLYNNRPHNDMVLSSTNFEIS